MSAVPDRLAAAFTGRYRIERELGAGGMATVYLARDLKHDHYLLSLVPRMNALRAVQFDLARLTAIGDAVPLTAVNPPQGVDLSAAAVSSDGRTMVLGLQRRTSDQVYWVDRDGHATVIDPGWNEPDFETPALSPDGKKLAIEQGPSLEVKVLDHGPATRIAVSKNLKLWRPAWRPDGREISYYRTGPGSLDSVMVRRADGVGNTKPLVSDPRGVAEAEWTPDGRWIVYRTSSQASATGADILGVRTNGDTTPVPLLTTPANEVNPGVSPDGHWLAYASDETGPYQIFVCPFPDTRNQRVPVSTHGGVQPRWGHSGKELFFESTDGYLIAAEVSTTPSFSVTKQDTLFSLAPYLHGSPFMKEYDATGNGQSFVMVGAGDGPPRLVEVDGLQAVLPRKK